MARPKKLKESLIQPSVIEDGHPHVFEKIWDGDQSKMPVLKSIGYVRLPNTNQWVSYILTSKGKDVLSIEADSPNDRLVAEDATRVNFVSQFMDLEV